MKIRRAGQEESSRRPSPQAVPRDSRHTLLINGDIQSFQTFMRYNFLRAVFVSTLVPLLLSWHLLNQWLLTIQSFSSLGLICLLLLTTKTESVPCLFASLQIVCRSTFLFSLSEPTSTDIASTDTPHCFTIARLYSVKLSNSFSKQTLTHLVTRLTFTLGETPPHFLLSSLLEFTVSLSLPSPTALPTSRALLLLLTTHFWISKMHLCLPPLSHLISTLSLTLSPSWLLTQQPRCLSTTCVRAVRGQGRQAGENSDVLTLIWWRFSLDSFLLLLSVCCIAYLANCFEPSRVMEGWRVKLISPVWIANRSLWSAKCNEFKMAYLDPFPSELNRHFMLLQCQDVFIYLFFGFSKHR